MKVKVTIENLENGAKDSAIGDGVMAYIKVGNNDHILALGKYDSMEAVSGIAYGVAHSASKRHPKGTAGVYEDIISRLKEDAMIAKLKSSAMTPQELEKKLIDAIRSAFKDEGEKE